MREIKFRGYDGMDWIYGSAVQYVKELNTWYMIENGAPDDDWTMVGEIGQYTGLKDKNGKEIYEGDLVTHEEDGETWGASQIVFEQGMYCFEWDYPNHLGLYENLEVIGNNYENPELKNGFKD